MRNPFVNQFQHSSQYQTDPHLGIYYYQDNRSEVSKQCAYAHRYSCATFAKVEPILEITFGFVKTCRKSGGPGTLEQLTRFNVLARNNIFLEFVRGTVYHLAAIRYIVSGLLRDAHASPAFCELKLLKYQKVSFFYTSFRMSTLNICTNFSHSLIFK